MSLLVTVARYRTLTGDNTTAASAASAAIEDATSLLSEDLGRPDALDSRERTETMHIDAGGMCRPLAVPVTVCAGFDFDTAAIHGASPDTGPFRGLEAGDLPATVAVTYTGGWLERTANPSATNRLPLSLEADIAHAAYHLCHPATPGAVPAGVSSVSMGDASVSYGPSGAPSGATGAVSWSRQTMRWKRRLP